MGNAQSMGSSQSELTDGLVENGTIESSHVEFAFRLVDRRLFFTPSSRSQAYMDGAWRERSETEPPVHISAPAIYASALEHFNLKKGMTFLNIGSGSGYFSTMVGLYIGSCGVNHGIEINSEIVKYANERKEAFIKEGTISAFDWCSPDYFVGNVYNMKIDMKYDRIYLGARVPPGDRLRFLKMLKIEGICIMPYGNVLQQIRRASEKTFICRDISTVEFGKLIKKRPSSDDNEMELPLPVLPRSLFDITRASLRQNIRDHVGKKAMIHVNQKIPMVTAEAGYPRDASEDEMLIDHPRIAADDVPQENARNENIDRRQPPETNDEGYIIYPLQRDERLRVQINALRANIQGWENFDLEHDIIEVPRPNGANDGDVDMRDGVPILQNMLGDHIVLDEDDDDDEHPLVAAQLVDDAEQNAAANGMDDGDVQLLENDHLEAEDDDEGAEDDEDSSMDEEEDEEESEDGEADEVELEAAENENGEDANVQEEEHPEEDSTPGPSNDVSSDEEQPPVVPNPARPPVLDRLQRLQRINQARRALFEDNIRNMPHREPNIPPGLRVGGGRGRLRLLDELDMFRLPQDFLANANENFLEAQRRALQHFRLQHQQRQQLQRENQVQRDQQEQIRDEIQPEQRRAPADDTSSTSSSPSRGRKRRAGSTEGDDKRPKIEEKLFDPPEIFRQPYVRAVVQLTQVRERHRPNYQEKLDKELKEYDARFRSIVQKLQLPRKLMTELLFINFN